MEFAQRNQPPFRSPLVPTQRSHNRNIRIRRARVVLQRKAQYRMRTDLDEKPMAIRQQLLDGIREANGLTQVAIPISRVQLLGLDLAPRDRGIQWNAQTTRRDTLQRPLELFPNSLHLREVRGVVHADRT